MRADLRDTNVFAIKKTAEMEQNTDALIILHLQGIRFLFHLEVESVVQFILELTTVRISY